MSEVGIFVSEGKVCYDVAASGRDAVANIAILLPSLRIIHPVRGFAVCVERGNDRVVVKWYESNRGVPYLRIYAIGDRLERVADFSGRINAFAVRAVLKQLGVDNDTVSRVLALLGLED